MLNNGEQKICQNLSQIIYFNKIKHHKLNDKDTEKKT